MKRIIYLLLLVVVVLAGCKSSKHLATSETKTSTKAPTSSYLASKLHFRYRRRPYHGHGGEIYLHGEPFNIGSEL